MKRGKNDVLRVGLALFTKKGEQKIFFRLINPTQCPPFYSSAFMTTPLLQHFGPEEDNFKSIAVSRVVCRHCGRLLHLWTLPTGKMLFIEATTYTAVASVLKDSLYTVNLHLMGKTNLTHRLVNGGMPNSLNS